MATLFYRPGGRARETGRVTKTHSVQLCFHIGYDMGYGKLGFNVGVGDVEIIIRK